MAIEREIFYTLFDALKDGVGAPELVTAIEAKPHPLYWRDDFDRYARADTQTIGLVVETLRVYHLDDDCEDGVSFEDLGLPDSVFSRAGWPLTMRPSFSANPSMMPAAGSKPDARKEQSDLAIIGALVRLIQGKLGSGTRALCASDAEIIEVITESLSGVRGLGRRTLEERFKLARQHLENAEN